MDEAEAEQDALQTRVRDEAQCDALSLLRLVRALHRSGNFRESFSTAVSMCQLDYFFLNRRGDTDS